MVIRQGTDFNQREDKYIIVIVNKLSSNILSAARRFGKVTEYLTEACRGQIFSHFPNLRTGGTNICPQYINNN